MKMKTMTKIEMGTSLLIAGLRPSTYEYDLYGHYEQIKEDLNEGILKGSLEEIHDYYERNFDFEGWEKNFGKIYKEIYEKGLLKFLQEKTDSIKSIEVKSEIQSPKEYNFSTDWMDFDLEIDKEKFVEFVKSLEQEDLEKFLKENYTSYDGFGSYTANNLEDLFIGLEEENPQEYGAVINYLLDDVDVYKEFLGDIYFELEGYYSDYLSEEIFEKFGGENK